MEGASSLNGEKATTPDTEDDLLLPSKAVVEHLASVALELASTGDTAAPNGFPAATDESSELCSSSRIYNIRTAV